MALHSTAKFFTVLCLLAINANFAVAQSAKVFRAAVIQDGTKEKVQDAIVENLKSGLTKKTDNFGFLRLFQLLEIH